MYIIYKYIIYYIYILYIIYTIYTIYKYYNIYIYIILYIYIIHIYSTPLYTHISGWIIETHQPEVGLSSGKVPSVTIGVTSLWGLVIHPEISGRINYQKVLKWEIGASLQTRNKFKTTLKTSAIFSKKKQSQGYISPNQMSMHWSGKRRNSKRNTWRCKCDCTNGCLLDVSKWKSINDDKCTQADPA